jgi:hypothetical protein
MKNKPEHHKLIVEMLKQDFIVIKKLAIDQNITLKVLVIRALAEYAAKNGKI